MLFKPLLVALFGLTGFAYLAFMMISTGKVKRKGAKKLRKKLFPAFYGKKSAFKKDRI